MRFDIRYRTVFTYENLVRESQNELRACPANDDHQQLIAYRVSSAPSARMLAFADYWGTRVDAFGVRTPHLTLDVTAEASVETRLRPLVAVSPRADALSAAPFIEDHLEYRERSPHCSWRAGVAAAAEYATALGGPSVVSQVLAIHRYAGNALVYEPGSTSVGIPVEDVLAGGRGVCQDFAHLAVAMCRASSIPARYVSGYLFTTDDSTGADSEDADVVRVQTHAWFEAAIPGFGWLALDPTNQQEVGLRHVKIGHGRDYDDVPPIRGVYAGPGAPEVEVSVEIRKSTGAVPGRPEPPSVVRRRRFVPDPLPLGDDARQQQQAQQQ
jgi:transglutaminase-like putative cysteine protease